MALVIAALAAVVLISGLLVIGLAMLGLFELAGAHVAPELAGSAEGRWRIGGGWEGAPM